MGKTVAAQNSTIMQNSSNEAAKASPRHKERGKEEKKKTMHSRNHPHESVQADYSFVLFWFGFFNAENSYRKNYGKSTITPLAGENVMRKRCISKWLITDFAPTKFFRDG